MERVTRRFLDAQAGRIAALVPGVSIVVDGGPGWTAYADSEDGGYRSLAYGRTKGELSAMLDAVEAGLWLGGAS